MPKILHLTISPCDNERRIFNQALSASRRGWQVEILALKTPEVPETSLIENVIIHRLKIRWWRGGPLKFLTFNRKLFFRLLREPYDILHVHDLWVLPAAALAKILKGGRLIYDAHEYYRGLEIFKRKPLSRALWMIAERWFIGKAETVIAINSFHAELFRKRYPQISRTEVIMNVPIRREISTLPAFSERKPVVLFQGIFKPARGLSQVIEAIHRVENGAVHLIGFGEEEPELRRLVKEFTVEDKVRFIGKMSWDEVLSETRQVRAGIVLFEPINENYQYASPNKFFEYVMAGTPVIASDIPTFREFIKRFEVGILVSPYSPVEIVAAIEKLLSDENSWNFYHQNCLKAREVWNWEQQEEKLMKIYDGRS